MITLGRLPPPSASTTCWGTSNPLMGSAGSTRARNFMICSSRLVASSLCPVLVAQLTHSAGGAPERALSLPEIGQAPLEQMRFCVVVDKYQRALVGRAGLVVPAETVQQLGAGGMQVMEVLQRERVEDPKPCFGPLLLRDRDRPVELHHGRARHAR